MFVCELTPQTFNKSLSGWGTGTHAALAPAGRTAEAHLLKIILTTKAQGDQAQPCVTAV